MTDSYIKPEHREIAANHISALLALDELIDIVSIDDPHYHLLRTLSFRLRHTSKHLFSVIKINGIDTDILH